jgi:hypothetical protein
MALLHFWWENDGVGFEFGLIFSKMEMEQLFGMASPRKITEIKFSAVYGTDEMYP